MKEARPRIESAARTRSIFSTEAGGNDLIDDGAGGAGRVGGSGSRAGVLSGLLCGQAQGCQEDKGNGKNFHIAWGLEAHHLLKLHCLAAADLDLFPALHFQEEASVEIRLDLFDQPEIDDMFAVGAEEDLFVEAFFQCV